MSNDRLNKIDFTDYFTSIDANTQYLHISQKDNNNNKTLLSRGKFVYSKNLTFIHLQYIHFTIHSTKNNLIY